METAKLFVNGKSQAVRLPKEYRFSGDEVGIRKVGDIVLLFPKDGAWSGFLSSSPVSDDLGETILAARQEHLQTPREYL
ncbi:MAG: type II toxin-antitoxin system VapB family antitoxin [Oscillospiraceae bacterium]|jgi:antitoxin VapB|nr:type II toxin-antitoxin system VapB family antitoxin [Oscillospiraceae bacterium]